MEVQPATKAANQKIKEKLLASQLHPAGFEIALKMMKAEVERFPEANLPLLAEALKLAGEYDKIMGATTMTWNGEEKTFWEIISIYSFETIRTAREKAWGALWERPASAGFCIQRACMVCANPAPLSPPKFQKRGIWGEAEGFP